MFSAPFLEKKTDESGEKALSINIHEVNILLSDLTPTFLLLLVYEGQSHSALGSATSSADTVNIIFERVW